MRTRIKICGFTRKEDAVIAANLGVDAIGLVFYAASPRHVSIEQAAEIVAALPAFVTVVALFVNEQDSVIRNVLANVPVDCVQFHGEEPPELCRLYGKRYIKAVRMQQHVDLIAYSQHYYDADALLLDTYHPDAPGGTGTGFDWKLISERQGLPIILAGGLDAVNAQTAITQVRPFALDVSSGVETGKGLKDKDKMKTFVNAVYQGDLRIQ